MVGSRFSPSSLPLLTLFLPSARFSGWFRLTIFQLTTVPSSFSFRQALPKVMARCSQGLGKELARCSHTLAILFPYFKVWQHYGNTMASLWHHYGIIMASPWERREKGVAIAPQPSYSTPPRPHQRNGGDRCLSPRRQTPVVRVSNTRQAPQKRHRCGDRHIARWR